MKRFYNELKIEVLILNDVDVLSASSREDLLGSDTDNVIIDW